MIRRDSSLALLCPNCGYNTLGIDYGMPTELSGWISNLVRSPAKSGNPASKKRTKRPKNMKPIATYQFHERKLCCPRCGRAISLSKSTGRKVRRYGAKSHCPVCGLVSPVDQSLPLPETPARKSGWPRHSYRWILIRKSANFLWYLCCICGRQKRHPRRT